MTSPVSALAWTRAALLVALVLPACAQVHDAQPASENPSGPAAGASGGRPGGSLPNGGPPGSPGPGMAGSSGTGGSTSAGSGGSGAGSGGATGFGGSSGAADAGAPPIHAPDAGAAADAAADAAPGSGEPPPCAIALRPISPQRTSDVPAGEGYRFRMGGTATGRLVPGKPAWRWVVRHQSGQTIMHSAVDGEPSMIDFPTVLEGRYDVSAELDGVAGCIGRESISAIVPSRRVLDFLVRVTPPAGLGLPVFESDVYVQSGVEVARTLELPSNVPAVRVMPHDRTQGLPAYFVQISSPMSTTRFEGYVDTRNPNTPWFEAPLDRRHRYDVLIVPDLIAGAPPRAPRLFPGLSPADDFGRTDFEVDGGVLVAGTITSATGALPGSRVRLRDGLLPSTIGTADAGGGFGVRTRGGRFEVRVLPPAGSGLPEAQLPRSAGILVDPSLGLGGNLDFSYAALPMARLALTILRPDGSPADKSVSIVLETVEGGLGNVGNFTLPGQPAVPADGIVRLVQASSGAMAVFEKLPRGRYRAILSPPDNLAGDAAITSVDLDLTGGAATVMRTVTLAKRGRIAGRLTPAATAAGLTVRAVDVAEDGVGRNPIMAAVSGEGRFEIPADPGRVYRLFVEPPPDRRVPRLALDPVRATATTVSIEYPLPQRLRVHGQTMVSGRGGLPGAIVQVFCRGAAPACVDRQTPDLSNTLPVDETISGTDGRYELWVPDPGK